MAPHPWLPYLATCGIDSDGKVWEPGEEITFDPLKADKLTRDNKDNSHHDEGEVHARYVPSSLRASFLRCVLQISMTALWNFLAMLRSRGGTGNGNIISQLFGSDSSNEDDSREFYTSELPAAYPAFAEDEDIVAADMELVELANQTRERGAFCNHSAHEYS